MWSTSSVKVTLAGAMLIWSIIGDLRSRKVKNSLVVSLAGSALILTGFLEGPAGLTTSFFSFLTATVAVLPLYLLRVLGGGDVKLFMALSLLMDWQTSLYTIAFSFIWGSILGVTVVILKGQGRAFLNNLVSIFWRVRPAETQTHKIPFTVALALGYFSAISAGGIL